MNKKEARVRRARKTRLRIAEQRATRLVVGRSNCHIYAQIVAPTGDKVLASASTLEADVRKDVPNGGNKAAAAMVGKRIAENLRLNASTGIAESRDFSTGVQLQLNDQTAVEAVYNNQNATSASQIGDVGVDLKWRLEFD